MNHEDYHAIEAAFIDGFRSAPDKRAFLQLAKIPLEIGEGTHGLKLLEVRLNDQFAVGAASPGFGGAGLVYQPLPGAMVDRKTALSFVYVSIRETRELSLAEVFALTGEAVAEADHGHSHSHHHSA